MVPRKNSNEISDILKTPVGRDKFLNEVHPKLRPVETVIDGIYIAGTCQGPKNITESVKSSLAASAKANSLISSGVIEIEPTIAKVDPEICEWCGKCVEICTYNSISKTQYKGKTIATINETKCKGCGMCSAVCLSDAIEIFGYKNKEIDAIMDGLINK